MNYLETENILRLRVHSQRFVYKSIYDKMLLMDFGEIMIEADLALIYATLGR